MPANTLLAVTAYTLILKMEAVLSSETSVNFYQTTQCHIPNDSTVVIAVKAN
jgi:hypothetical protein